MLSNVSWGQFMTWMAVIFGLYYLWVFIRYYRHDAVEFVKKKRKAQPR